MAPVTGASYIWIMEAIGLIAVAVGIVCFVLIAAISLRGPRNRNAWRRGDRFIPGNWHPDDGAGDVFD